jgi:hypothetical protein
LSMDVGGRVGLVKGRARLDFAGGFVASIVGREKTSLRNLRLVPALRAYVNIPETASSHESYLGRGW